MLQFTDVSLEAYVKRVYEIQRDYGPKELALEHLQQLRLDVTVGRDVFTDVTSGVRACKLPPVPYCLAWCLDAIVRNPYDPEIRAQYRSLVSAQRVTAISVLHAHGDTNEGMWYYYEYGVPIAPIQEWIDRKSKEHAGTNALLVIGACNPDRLTPVKRDVSLLFVEGILSSFENRRSILLTAD